MTDAVSTSSAMRQAAETPPAARLQHRQHQDRENEDAPKKKKEEGSGGNWGLIKISSGGIDGAKPNQLRRSRLLSGRWASSSGKWSRLLRINSVPTRVLTTVTTGGLLQVESVDVQKMRRKHGRQSHAEAISKDSGRAVASITLD